MSQTNFAPKRKMDAGTLARIGMMCAFSIVLSFIEIPMAFFAPWLKLDFSFVPMLLTGFSLGFFPGLSVLVLLCVSWLLKSSTGGVGEIATFLIGLAMLVPSVVLYKRVHTRKGALIGMLVGVAAMTVTAVLANLYILLPLYLGDGLAGYMEIHPYIVWTAVVPFNLVKGVAICFVTYILYKRLSHFLKRGLRA